ncbi:hypothetical protein RJ639_019556 [Escallonia herrerae]|uniref:CAF1B/HIR1 beta-propeller domain-containing protein n=1 Tax=Escallonia herrerae TaxID=1293975 RepID=A0AA88V6U9_9ASTE|nr:hypothetical protein RJ639_019556 [Escallonia herrerae]
MQHRVSPGGEKQISRFHRKDVLDLRWSADGAFLISGSVDNSCIIWDVNKGSVQQILDAHFHYVQGVAFDPLAKYAASLSSDRTFRIYVNKPQAKTKGIEKMNYVCQHVITKVEPQMTEDSESVFPICLLILTLLYSRFFIFDGSKEKKVLSNGNKIPLQKPEEMATIEAATNKTDIVGDSKNAEVKKSDGKQASPSLVSTPVPNKPAKRRITPMAID